MSCDLCHRNPHTCHTCAHTSHYAQPYYSDVPDMSNHCEEPEAPILSLGNRILWLTDTSAASGIVRWIGRIPSISDEWSAGIEFDNVMPNGGSGDFNRRRYFHSRPGHALFLPVSDVIKVDGAGAVSGNSERTFFGRLQDSCSNFAHRKRRDSTFGHFKQECYATCNHNFPYNGLSYGHAPVYDRITSRRSLYFEDPPYEPYNNRVPCSSQAQIPLPSTSGAIISNQHMEHGRTNSRDLIVRRLSNEANCSSYCEQSPNEITVARKESIFGPWPSFSLISGFKEWVSCLVLGTNRRKSKSKIVLQDRKSITSYVLTNNSQSMTGQRLSSFSDYASINVSKMSQRSIPSHSGKAVIEESESSNLPKAKKKSRKKLPAPLPPIEKPKELNENVVSVASERSSCRKGSGRNAHNTVVSKTVRTVNTISQSAPIKRRQKKRMAPPPPAVGVPPVSAIYASVKKEYKNNHASSKNGNYGRKSQKMHWVYPTHEEQIKPDFAKSNRHPPRDRSHGTHPPVHIRRRADDSSSDESESGSISLSPDEDTGDEKYGMHGYRKATGFEGEASPRSNFVQYSSDNSDVCLKISIKKTETNVVTVEEVSAPHTVRYTIEDESSSSDLSDNPPQIPTKTKAIEDLMPKANMPKWPHCELGEKSDQPLQNSNDSSPTEENGEKPNTIFEELQLSPPVRGSVKDFVQAFNMLANKGNEIPAYPQKPPTKGSSAGIADPSHAKNIQSFPTNWEFQNKVGNVNFPPNQVLLPIAEEPFNDNSEQEDANDKTLVLKKQANLKIPGVRTSEKNGADRCSHCSETHASESNDGVRSRSPKKRMAPKLNKIPNVNHEVRLDPLSSQASMAALSSLLNGIQNGKIEDAPSTSKLNTKPDQPIMVGLYIEDKSSHRGPIPLLVSPSMSLRKLKKQVEAEYDFPRYQQCWILGESFAVQDEATLASYGVTEAGCPVLLYVMSSECKSRSLPSRNSLRPLSRNSRRSSGSSEDESAASPRHHRRSHRRRKSSAEKDRERHLSEDSKKPKDETDQVNLRKNILKGSPIKRINRIGSRKGREEETDYGNLVALDDVDLVANVEAFECPVCFMEVDEKEGCVLQDCLHYFCKECLAGAVQYSDTAVIKCPFRNDEYSCESHLQEREIKCLVSPEVYERHLQRSMALAESQAPDSFHCKTPDCPGWCLFEDNVNTFRCPVCKRTNCLTCAAVHEGRNCRQYQDNIALHSDTSEEAKKTKEYLQGMVENGEAMECPQCQVILMKKWGCDWLKCSMCHTEVCWVTKGPRWGPGGKGDTSGGCKCMLNGVRCHPKCSYCH